MCETKKSVTVLDRGEGRRGRNGDVPVFSSPICRRCMTQGVMVQ